MKNIHSHYPNMRESRIQALLAISTIGFRDDRNDGHGDSRETILKNADPNDLETVSASDPRESRQSRPSCIVSLTLNQVNPLRGVLQQPLSPPQHLASQVNGQTQLFGLIARK